MDWVLFVSAFLSATLLPGSSEALLLIRLGEGHAWPGLLVAATLGNLLGSVSTYLIGRLGNVALHGRWLGIGTTGLQRAERWFERWGSAALLLAWLPVVGDPLCLFAGLMRFNPVLFVVLVGLGKLARYGFLIAVGVAGGLV